MRPQKLPHSIYQLQLLGGINGVKIDTWWQLSAADEGLHIISNSLLSKDRFLVPYDHVIYVLRRPDIFFQGISNDTARGIVGSVLNGEQGRVAAVMSGRKRLSDGLGLLFYSDGIEQYLEDEKNKCIDAKKTTRAEFRWDDWRPQARGDESFFKVLVNKCPMMEYKGIEEFLDFKPL